MEWTKSFRPFVIGLFALSMSALSHAEPAKAPPPKPSETPAAPIILASAVIQHPASEASDSGAADPNEPQKRKRAARSTTCRCGGQTTPSQD